MFALLLMSSGVGCPSTVDDPVQVTTDSSPVWDDGENTTGGDDATGSTTTPMMVDPWLPDTDGGSGSTGDVPEGSTSTGEGSTGSSGSTGSPEALCGNNVVDDGEECDDGENSEHGACTPDCMLAFCGDGYVRMGADDEADNEECDLGEENGPDATCDESCTLRALAVFVTSLEFNGNLKDHDPLKQSGVNGADAVCQALADEVGLSQVSSFKAWISDGATSPAERFTAMAGGRSYALLDGTPIASDWSDLVDGSIANPINLTELWAAYDGMGDESELFALDAFVWTNTDADASAIGEGQSCTNWSNASSEKFGWFGWTGAKDDAWTKTSSDLCSAVSRLYCFEQPEPGDG